MKPLLHLFLLASILILIGCSKDPTILEVQVTDATYNYRKDLKDRADLVAFEKLLEDRESAPAPKGDFFYVLAIQGPSKKEYWNYNTDGNCVVLQDGKPLAFYRLKNPGAFNELIGIEKSN